MSPEQERIFLEMLAAQQSQPQGRAHGGAQPNQFQQQQETLRALVAAGGQGLGRLLESPVAQHGLTALDRYTQGYMRPAAFLSTLGGMSRAGRARQPAPEGHADQAMGLMRGIAEHAGGVPPGTIGGQDYAPGMVTGNPLLDQGLEAVLAPDFWIPGIGVIGAGAVRATRGGRPLGIAARRVLAETRDPANFNDWRRAFETVADEVGVPESARGLLASVLDPAQGYGLPAPPRAVATQAAKKEKMKRAETYLRGRTARMTDADLDRWAERVNSGIRVEDYHRTVRLGDGRTFNIEHWYDTSAVRQVFNEALGPQGDAMFDMFTRFVGATSPRTNVRDNVSASVQVLRHLSNGMTFEDIARMTPEQFGRLGPDDAALGNRLVYRGEQAPHRVQIAPEHAGATPGDLLLHGGYERHGDALVPKPRAAHELDAIGAPTTRAIDARAEPGGYLGDLLETGVFPTQQKIGTFGPNMQQRHMGHVTIDIHNIRQTLDLLDVPLNTPGQRRAFLERMGVNPDTDAFRPFTQRMDGSRDDIVVKLAEALYGGGSVGVSGGPLYSVIEQTQIAVLDRLIATGRVPPMDPAVFQARLWVGGGVSSPVDAAPVTQIIFDVLDTMGRANGIYDPADQIRYVFGDSGASAGMLLETARRMGGLEQFGIRTADDLGELMLTTAGRVESRTGARDLARGEDEPAELGTLRELRSGDVPDWVTGR